MGRTIRPLSSGLAVKTLISFAERYHEDGYSCGPLKRSVVNACRRNAHESDFSFGGRCFGARSRREEPQAAGEES